MADEPHPQAREVLAMMDAQNTPPTYGVTPAIAREQFRRLTAEMPATEVGDVAEFAIEGPAGPIPIRAYVPAGEGPFPVLVYYHGGGWVIGGLDEYENLTSALCAGAEAVVLSVDYRLAPENPFPAQLADAYAALEWAAEYAGHVSGDPDRVAVGGDSAGGNLAAAVSLLSRDRDGPDIAHQSLVYPAVASPVIHDFDSYEENAEGYFLEWESVQWFYDKWLPSELHARNEYAAPLLARDLSGLPSATVVTAGFDPIRDEGIAYADRLAEADVPVHHEHYDDMIHGFASMTELLDASHAAIDVVAAEVAGAFDA
jgi:acetyl esterase